MREPEIYYSFFGYSALALQSMKKSETLFDSIKFSQSRKKKYFK